MTPPLEGRALVVLHQLDASLGGYDVASGRELFRLPTAEFPHELCLSPDRRRLYVTEYGLRGVESEGEGGNTVAVFDLHARARVGTLSTGEYRRPHGVAADVGGRLYVTSEPRRTLLIFRLEDQSFLHVVDVEQEIPHVVAVSPDGRTAVTANIGSGTVWQAYHTPGWFDYAGGIFGANPVGVAVKLALYTYGVSDCHAEVNKAGQVIIGNVDIETGVSYEAKIGLSTHVEAAGIGGEAHAFTDFLNHQPTDCGGRRWGVKVRSVRAQLHED